MEEILFAKDGRFILYNTELYRILTIKETMEWLGKLEKEYGITPEQKEKIAEHFYEGSLKGHTP